MKVLIISDYANINGGCAKVAIQTANGLAIKGNEVVFFAGSGKPDKLLLNSNIRIVNINNHDLMSGNRIKMFFKGIKNKEAMKALDRLLKTLGSDYIVHIHSWVKVLSPGIFDVISKYKNRVFITAHDYFLICPNGGFYNYKKNIICDEICRKKCNSINCDSRNFLIKRWRLTRFKKQSKLINKLDFQLITLSSLMKKQFDLNKIPSIVLNNPIEMNTSSNNITELKELCFAYVGRLSFEKGVDIFCEALLKSGLKGYIFGDGPLLNELRKNYNCPNIIFMGWMKFDDILNHLNKIVSLVFPSRWYEGAPLTIPEFGSYGIPSIISNACSGVDYVIDDNSLIFNCDDVNDLILKMKIAIEKYSDLNSRKTVSSSYLNNNSNIDIYTNRLIDIYNKC